MITRRLDHLAACLLLSLVASVDATYAQDSSQQDQTLSQEEIAQLVAPIALYPDSLVSQILMASTYPLEVVQAARWVQDNSSLQGDALSSALDQQSWDPSVKSLVNFPDVLKMMNDKLDWMTKLGDAFLAQQKDVLDEIQTLRGKAKDEGNLQSSQQQNVTVEGDTITIQSTNPDVVYVPTYDPTVVYGTWPYPSYPPYYYYPPGYRPGGAAIAWGAGFACGAAWGYAWGNCDWHGGDIKIDNSININRNPNIVNSRDYRNAARGQEWRHDPAHRRGASYDNRRLAQQYGRAGTTDAARARDQYRGRAEQGRQDLARGGADQFRGGQRQPGAANRTGERGPGDAGRRDVGSGGQRDFQRGAGSSAFDRSSGAQQTRQASQRGNYSRGSSGYRSAGGGRSIGGARGGGGRRR